MANLTGRAEYSHNGADERELISLFRQLSCHEQDALVLAISRHLRETPQRCTEERLRLRMQALFGRRKGRPYP